MITDSLAGFILPRAHCAFRGCNWSWSSDCEDVAAVNMLRQHLLLEHLEIFTLACGTGVKKSEVMDYYEEALLHSAGKGVPSLSLSTDRRALMQLHEVFKDASIRTLVCSICAEKHLEAGVTQSCSCSCCSTRGARLRAIWSTPSEWHYCDDLVGSVNEQARGEEA